MCKPYRECACHPCRCSQIQTGHALGHALSTVIQDDIRVKLQIAQGHTDENGSKELARLQEVHPPETLTWHFTACSNSCLMRRQLVLGHCASWQRLTWSSSPIVRCSCAARLARSSSLSRSVVSLIFRACAWTRLAGVVRVQGCEQLMLRAHV